MPFTIKENVKLLLAEMPPGVKLVGAAKTRLPEEILEAVEGGLEIIGENYVQEAEKARAVIGDRVQWHMIGHLQSNKARRAVQIFDMIQTVDSLNLGRAIDRAAAQLEKTMPVLVEINSACESRKAGVMPEEAVDLVKELSRLEHLRVLGLMTMGPFLDDPEALRPYFRLTRSLFETIGSLALPRVEMRHLSMGMSDSYKVAMEEGADLIRIGTMLFGPRRLS